jgi:hypothetical protein
VANETPVNSATSREVKNGSNAEDSMDCVVISYIPIIRSRGRDSTRLAGRVRVSPAGEKGQAAIVPEICWAPVVDEGLIVYVRHCCVASDATAYDANSLRRKDGVGFPACAGDADLTF